MPLFMIAQRNSQQYLQVSKKKKEKKKKNKQAKQSPLKLL
jgi:hypothetical protein